MTKLAKIDGLSIEIYQEHGKHNTPHIHVKHAEYSAVFDLEGKKLKGELSSKQEKKMTKWIIAHHQELVNAWNLLQNGKSPSKITSSFDL